MSSLQDISFHLGRSPITIRPLWKLFSSFIWAGCPLQWNYFEKSLHFSPPLKFFCLGWLPIIMKPFWEILAFLTTFKTFHLGRSPITTRSLWKICVFFATLKNLCIFHHFENSFHFSPEQVTHYNKTTLKNLCIFHLFEKSLYFSPGQVALYNKTTLKNLRIFHHFEMSLYFSLFWKNLQTIFAFFTRVGRPLQ